MYIQVLKISKVTKERNEIYKILNNSLRIKLRILSIRKKKKTQLKYIEQLLCMYKHILCMYVCINICINV